MSGYFTDLLEGGESLISGLAVTLRAMVSPVVTVQYPREKIEITPNYRGHIELTSDGDNAIKCIACGMCERSCPSNCITLTTEKREGEKKKTLTSFMLDFTKCSLCGICCESCPAGAIRYSDEYNLAGFTRDDFIMDLLKRLEAKK